ncbi:hypothetical protein Acr_08g0010560 [Actinidia rufa]|uniref:Uncharacterized protein n=1 Tax=Actinidia rufa TaxID=165716 RepID=A0A7J0F1X6_9ERIC|nr:hypothetical protein Acr_08g0010560 [Actinidia rufa]
MRPRTFTLGEEESTAAHTPRRITRQGGAMHTPRAHPVSAQMEDILFCKDLHNPLDNKGEKPVAKKDKEWRKMNRKTIGLIRQCIGHEVFHHIAQETSTYELWIKLGGNVSGEDISEQSLIDEETCEFEASERDYSGETYERVPEFGQSVDHNSTPNGKLTTSMVMDVLFNEEARKRGMVLTDQSESQALVSEGSRERGRGQGRGHHRGTRKGRWRSQARDTTTTTVMAVDESDVLLAALDNEKSDWSCWQRVSPVPYGRREVCDVDRGKRGDAVGKEYWKAKLIGGDCPTWVQWYSQGEWTREATVSQSAGRCFGICTEACQTRVVQPVQDVHRESQRKKTKSILRSCTAKGAATPKRVSFALDLINGGILSSCAHKGGEMELRQLAK